MATGDYQLNEQHQIKEDSDAAEDVAVDILQKSDEIHRVDFLEQLQDSKLNRSCVVAAFQVSSPSSAQGSQTKRTRGRGAVCDRSSSVTGAVFLMAVVAFRDWCDRPCRMMRRMHGPGCERVDIGNFDCYPRCSNAEVDIVTV